MSLSLHKFACLMKDLKALKALISEQEYTDGELSIAGQSPLTIYRRVHAPVTEADLHDDADSTLDLGPDVFTQPGWSQFGVNGRRFLGEPSHVTISGCVSAEDSGASSYWSRPRIRVTRNGVDIAPNLSQVVMQTNGAYDGSYSQSWSVEDPNPGVNPLYRFLIENNEARVATLPADAESHVALKAWM